MVHKETDMLCLENRAVDLRISFEISRDSNTDAERWILTGFDIIIPLVFLYCLHVLSSVSIL